MKLSDKTLLAGIVLSSFLFSANIISAAEPERISTVEVYGKVVEVNISNIPDSPWVIIALESEEDTTIYQLRGKLVNEIQNLEGKKVTIVGVLKSSGLFYKEKPLMAIEVKEYILEPEVKKP